MAKEKEEAKPVEAKEKAYRRAEVVTATALGIVDSTNKAMTQEDILLQLLNDVHDIKKAVA